MTFVPTNRLYAVAAAFSAIHTVFGLVTLAISVAVSDYSLIHTIVVAFITALFALTTVESILRIKN